jgi:hypothetical protein
MITRTYLEIMFTLRLRSFVVSVSASEVEP